MSYCWTVLGAAPQPPGRMANGLRQVAVLIEVRRPLRAWVVVGEDQANCQREGGSLSWCVLIRLYPALPWRQTLIRSIFASRTFTHLRLRRMVQTHPNKWNHRIMNMWSPFAVLVHGQLRGAGYPGTRGWVDGGGLGSPGPSSHIPCPSFQDLFKYV